MNKDKVLLEIPAEPKYLSLARLSLSGMAMNLNLDMDELEDLKLLITESCNLSFRIGRVDRIQIEIELGKSSLSFKVSGIEKKDLEENDEYKMSLMILESLGDMVELCGESLCVRKELENSYEER
ncbi:hypothetical protein LQU94_07310 [Peptoniphilus sp. KCTC 25270]|uniref:hypothetical protein n=1 Tax=Peptoniphilus sp. KCTC 25270 TaxID=2897414 RepID=UPI001E4EB6AA|nr:hypothetical protein [Peptoniphilus sp. KCTC 25270]MCD1147918.1 hypothetical protein [Peptoniphilus sp. KCTC 25270]